MRNIIEAAQNMIGLLDITMLEYSIDFGNTAHSKLEERISSYGWPVERLPTLDQNQYIFQVSNLIVEVERTPYEYITDQGEYLTREIIGVNMFGIDGNKECEPYELGDINEFCVERVALRKRDLPKVEFRAEKVRVWMQGAQVLAS